MSYSEGNRPFERASKSSHSYVINDANVQEFLKQCILPVASDEMDLSKVTIQNLVQQDIENVKHVIAFDGGYSDVIIRKEFPSATFAFLQMGALFFSLNDLRQIDEQSFIDPEDIAKLKNIERLKAAIPSKTIIIDGHKTFLNSFRYALYNFFKTELEEGLETFKWFLFEEYKSSPEISWILSLCPHCRTSRINLERAKISKYFTFHCHECNGEIYITDTLRLHEVVDEEMGASGALGYLSTSLEQFVMLACIRAILRNAPDQLHNIFFIKDGPLAFFGQTANMHKPMKSLIAYLHKHYCILAVGLEKSGAFVEHAKQISQRLLPGSFIIMDNNYIYRNILPGRSDQMAPYGDTTYYSSKVIFKSAEERVYVATIPVSEIKEQYTVSDVPHIHKVLSLLSLLKSDMYDNALLPVAMANKLISISNHPSANLLQKFATGNIIRT
ncbi:TPA: NurA domain-containing protein [Legionella pneumophila subsp. pneumophila]|uniref:hypothetical protein n=1 Tax=Legionella pneumophila TaxID=446 RepID=UPI0007784742|nr:hypothetical protein [Legionella pneumophila]HAT9588938.1 NurA domain-containing protein [Legionella pneumophila subsp. pneumophila]OOK44468.1 hypothetical protein LPM_0102 [Legionella pneumophila subsp. pneumophila str. Mississauga]HAT8622155.1 NurA domain-containing protein [Legionella pneumophila]HAU1836299.1 NurA domain-containing protein [Legionella pneumophila]HAU9855849.1 NurA domain-containing protein [Legionella pneumophila]